MSKKEAYMLAMASSLLGVKEAEEVPQAVEIIKCCQVATDEKVDKDVHNFGCRGV